MLKLSQILLILCFIVFTDCTNRSLYSDDDPIARVGENLLYPEDVSEEIPRNISKDDSVIMARKYIDTWIKKQLKLKKAEQNLPDDEKDIADELEDFKTSMLIYKYEQQIINQKLDTIVTPYQIAEYYTKYAGEFKLKENIIKADYIKIINDAPDVYKLRNLLRSEESKDKIALEEYCAKNAEEFWFSEDWIFLKPLLEKFPIQISGPVDQYLKYNNFIETRDSAFKYFVLIRDYKLKNDTTPLTLIQDEISIIILNKKKLELIRQMENDMYQSAVKKGDLEIF